MDALGQCITGKGKHWRAVYSFHRDLCGVLCFQAKPRPAFVMSIIYIYIHMQFLTNFIHVASFHCLAVVLFYDTRLTFHVHTSTTGNEGSPRGWWVDVEKVT